MKNMNKHKLHSFLGHTVIALAPAIYLDMQMGFHLLIGWLIFSNLVLFLSFGLDKKSAQKGWRRTPETTLLWLAFLGAFPALFFGRRYFRHKTVKQEFIWPMWTLFVIQLALVVYFVLQQNNLF